jgi:hypothetical protein
MKLHVLKHPKTAMMLLFIVRLTCSSNIFTSDFKGSGLPYTYRYSIAVHVKSRGRNNEGLHLGRHFEKGQMPKHRMSKHAKACDGSQLEQTPAS